MNDDDILYIILMILGYILRMIFWIFTFQWMMGMFSSRRSQYYREEDEQNNQGYDQQQQNNIEEDKAYKTLNVRKDCTADELKSSYRELAKKYHPDRSKDPKAGEKMAEINKAYDFILATRGVKH